MGIFRVREMKTLVATLCLVLSGCSLPIHNDFYQWYRSHDPLPFSWHEVPQSAVEAYCSHTKSMIYACAYWDHEWCWIFTEKISELTQDMVWHEEEHCRGVNHQVI